MQMCIQGDNTFNECICVYRGNNSFLEMETSSYKGDDNAVYVYIDRYIYVCSNLFIIRLF